MTVLEQWKQLAARENAAMRANLERRYDKPSGMRKDGAPRAKRQMGPTIKARMEAAVRSKPGLPRAEYLAAFGITENQWKGNISELLLTKRIVMVRNGRDCTVTYLPGDVQ